MPKKATVSKIPRDVRDCFCWKQLEGFNILPTYELSAEPHCGFQIDVDTGLHTRQIHPLYGGMRPTS
jgi:hypothetical protein